MSSFYKKIFLILSLLFIPLCGYLFWHFSTLDTLTTNLSQYQKAGDEVKNSLSSLPALPIQEEDTQYTIEDTTKEGIQITYANKDDNTALAAEPTPDQEKFSLTLHFPKKYATEPIEVQIAEGKSILIQDKQAIGDYTAQSLSLGGETPPLLSKEGAGGGLKNASSWLQSLLGGSTSKLEEERAYLSYTDATKRITTYYAYGHDQATGEKQLKNWQVYDHPAIVKGEQVAYSFTNAKLRKNDNGTISVYYYGDQELQNDKASAEVDPSLMARAQRTLVKDMGDSIDSGETPANFVIPKPYYINNNGDTITLDWRLSMDGKDISIDFTPDANEYPLALDPTLSFTAPGMSNTGDVITGEAVNDWFGYAMTSGDFNSDGKIDLAVGAYSYSTSGIGGVYIFYNDGSLPTTSSFADVFIPGEATNNYFGYTLTSGDWNADGSTDLAVQALSYSTNTGRVYIFYNDGSIPTTAATADVIITGEATNNYFGISFTSGDFNSDGKQDLAIGAHTYSTNTGRAYIFYNGSIITENASGADVIITGETTNNYFGYSFTSGDFNSDGKQDLAIGAYGYSTDTGRAYIFYNGSIITENASGADVIITGETTNNAFSGIFMTGDFNSDGKQDLATSASRYSSFTGRAYIFYNGSIITENASGADVIITGETTNNYFNSLISGDFNSDGKTDLAIGAYGYSTNTGRVYIFYNDGSIPTTAATADVIITGEGTNNYFGRSLVAGDFNADGKTDLAVGADYYSSNKGRAYIFYSQNGQVNTNQNITGNASGDYFGYAMTTGDFNADGKQDLAVGAIGYSTNKGRAYLFYGDGQIPNTAGTADVIITGEATNDYYFGSRLISGDFNSDGRTDLAVSGFNHAGRAYLFYNDGVSLGTTVCSTDCLASNADIILAGGGDEYFGYTLVSGDLNSDGRADLAIGAYNYSTQTGRAYIFYNDGVSFGTTACTTDCLASNADVIITGETTSNYFGSALTAGDWNADGKIDFAVGAYGYSTSTGRAYIFYNDGVSFGTTACTTDCLASNADVILTGETTSNGFGSSLITGDFNADSRTDLVVDAYSYSTNKGRIYIFYNDGSIPTAAATADVIITGEYGYDSFGQFLTAGDFNADGRIDLFASAPGSSTDTGRVYIFYNDGVSFGTVVCTTGCLAGNADVIITGETTNNYYGAALTAGDFNADGRADLVVSAEGYSTNTGRVYFYETRENFAWKLQALSPDTGGLRTGLSGTGQELKITGNSAGDYFGYAMTTGDFNADGKVDLAVGALAYNSNQGRVYIFYNDGSLSPGASGADVIITGETTSNYFGVSLVSGDFNADGRMDLAVGASYYSGVTGRAYIFYNDGSIPTTAGTADVIITGEGVNNRFGHVLVAGDFNSDGRMDLASGAFYYPAAGGTGRAYIFYNDGVSFGTVACTTGCLAANADIIITGDAVGKNFGSALSAGDLNADGRMDIVVGAWYNSGAIYAYIFYNDGVSFGSTVCTTGCLAANADVVVTHATASALNGIAMTTGDFNADGKIDLAVGSSYHNFATGKAFIFYADGTNNFGTATCAGSPSACSADNADVIITGESNSDFGNAMTAGDFNADGRTDLAVGGYAHHGSTIGKAYIFYNDGSIPTTATTADVILTGEASSNYFSYALAAGDLNSDGKTDLVVGAYGYASSKGRAYIYTLANDPVITGETTNNNFGTSLVSGDFNADGKADLAVGAPNYSTNTGRVYLFYQDGTIPSTAASADVIITGEATGHGFGGALAAGDLNADGKIDLAVGSASAAQKVYIFYNDGSIPTTAATADVIISGLYLGTSGMAIGDLNSDGRSDLLATAFSYGSDGRAYLFYADGTNNFGTAACTGSAPTTCSASDADIIIDGTGGARLGLGAIGDMNADGREDMILSGTNGTAGSLYILYNDGASFGTTACTTACSVTNADVIITGESSGNNFGTIGTGDFNADGKTDLAVGASGYSTNTGRAYIFYNDGISFGTTACTIDCLASNADVIITGEPTGNYFGYSLTAGDLNADGKTDLVVGAYGYSSGTGRTYIFYNDGSIPTTAATADVILTGEASSNYFGSALAAGDLNGDGKTDLAVGAYGYSTNTGRAYLFTSEAKVDSAPLATARVRGVGKLRGTSTLR